MTSGNTRPASHAGSWYDDDASVLARELEQNLELVPKDIHGKDLPITGARVIIAPHAGYSYSGKCAAWAYKTLDLTNINRVFVLGPSHTYYLTGCAVTTFSKYETPFGDLTVDRKTIDEVKAKGRLADMPPRNDISEHSLEMHLPYIYKRMEQTFGADASKFPPIVPILVGDGNKEAEKESGKLLAPFLADPGTAFVISSDFCHWGSRFDYTVFSPTAEVNNMSHLRKSEKIKADAKPVHETIKMVDQLAMDAIETGKHSAFVDNLRVTKNTVCGRHPIAVTMAAMEELAESGTEEGKHKFKFVRYERSSLVEDVYDSSVSYAAAYAIV